jgi:hypothetical protein
VKSLHLAGFRRMALHLHGLFAHCSLARGASASPISASFAIVLQSSCSLYVLSPLLFNILACLPRSFFLFLFLAFLVFSAYLLCCNGLSVKA